MATSIAFLFLLQLAAAVSQDTVEIVPGVMMPLLNLGNFNLSSNLSLWLDVGGRGIDTALSYGDSCLIDAGTAVRQSTLPRKDIFVTSKIPCGRDSLGSPEKDIEHHFKTIGLDYVDLLLMHWPCTAFGFGDAEGTAQYWKAMEPLVRSGKARAIGVSNFNSTELRELLETAEVKPAVNQCEFSVGDHDKALYGSDPSTRDYCKEQGITYAAYSPLGGNMNPFDVHHSKDVNEIAAAHNMSWAQVALRWVSQQGIIAVTSTTKESHMRGDQDSFSFNLTVHEMMQLQALHAENMIV